MDAICCSPSARAPHQVCRRRLSVSLTLERKKGGIWVCDGQCGDPRVGPPRERDQITVALRRRLEPEHVKAEHRKREVGPHHLCPYCLVGLLSCRAQGVAAWGVTGTGAEAIGLGLSSWQSKSKQRRSQMKLQWVQLWACGLDDIHPPLSPG